MDDRLLRKIRHVRERARNLEFDASTYSIELFAEVKDAWASRFWDLHLLAHRLDEMYGEVPDLRSALPAGDITLALWHRMSACPDLIDPRLIWVALTVHAPELVRQLESTIDMTVE